MAQDLTSDADLEEDPIEAAIRAFNNRDNSKPNEVIVVLEPENPKNQDEQEHAPKKEDPSETSEPRTSKAVLVTGKPPLDSEFIDLSDIPVVMDESRDPLPEKPEPKPGLVVRVKNVQSGKGEIDTSKVNLLAPFPAKPLSEPSAGWRLETSQAPPPFKRDVEIAPGKTITLTIRPHILIPDANGIDQFAVTEPGFKASLGYRQSDTVAASLAESVRKLDDDSKQLGTVIDQLQQLIVSLPKPETNPSPDPTTSAK